MGEDWGVVEAAELEGGGGESEVTTVIHRQDRSSGKEKVLTSLY